MQRVRLITNPISGQHSARRRAQLEAVRGVFAASGALVSERETDGPGSAATLARAAVEERCDTVVVCGGDGTVHHALQGLAGTEVALGVIPFGTANALAASLGLAGDPVRAARRLVAARAVRLPVGRIGYRNRQGELRERFFVVAAGVGPDAWLMAEMDPGLKRRLGYLLYLVDGLRIWARGGFPLFRVRIDGGEPRLASELLAVRVRSFGGAVGALVPGVSLSGERLSLVAFQTQSRWEYLRFVLGAALGRHSPGGKVERFEAHVVECEPLAEAHGSKGHARPATLRTEADGEPLGTVPVRMDVVADALTLLVPEGAAY